MIEFAPYWHEKELVYLGKVTNFTEGGGSQVFIAYNDSKNETHVHGNP